jgi:RNA polymerase sigma-70 factor (ECF subfamily)
VFAIARRRAGRAAWRRRLWVPLELALGTRSEAPSPEASAIARDEAARVRSAVAQLAPRDREALLLVAVGGLSMANAAAALGVSLSAVKMRLSRARARLAALLEVRHG